MKIIYEIFSIFDQNAEVCYVPLTSRASQSHARLSNKLLWVYALGSSQGGLCNRFDCFITKYWSKRLHNPP